MRSQSWTWRRAIQVRHLGKQVMQPTSPTLRRRHSPWASEDRHRPFFIFKGF